MDSAPTHRTSNDVTLRLIKWGFTNVIFALLPFLINIIVLWLHNRLTFFGAVKAPELFFFSIMIGATSLSDLRELSNRLAENNTAVFWSYAFLTFAILASVFYGVFLTSEVSKQQGGNLILDDLKVSLFSVGIALFSLALGTWTQIFIGRFTYN